LFIRQTTESRASSTVSCGGLASASGQAIAGPADASEAIAAASTDTAVIVLVIGR
jgi:hypothetical protein